MLGPETIIITMLSLMFIVFFVLVPIVIIYVILRYNKYKNMIRVAKQKIIADGHTLLEPGQFTNDGIYNTTGGVEYPYVFSGTLPSSKNSYWYALQSQTAGSGDTRRIYERTIIAVSIPDTKMQMIINSNLNRSSSGDDGAMATWKGVSLKTEGTFNSFFSVHVPQNTQTEALTLLAPDTMQYILAYCADYDIEIRGTQLYVYAYKHLPYEQSTNTLRIVDGLVAELTLRQQDGRTTHHSQPAVVARSATGMQTYAGIKPSYVKGVVWSLSGLAWIVVWFKFSSSPYKYALIPAIAALNVLFSASLALKERNLRNKYKNEVASILPQQPKK